MPLAENMPCILAPGYFWLIVGLWFMNVVSALIGVWAGKRDKS